MKKKDSILLAPELAVILAKAHSDIVALEWRRMRSGKRERGRHNKKADIKRRKGGK